MTPLRWAPLAISMTIAMAFVTLGHTQSPHPFPSIGEGPGSRSGDGAIDDHDIEIIYRWGVHGRNRLNTYRGLITKDLVRGPAASAPFELTAVQKSRIIAVADSVGFWDLPRMIAPPDTMDTVSVNHPFTKHALKIAHEGRAHVIFWDHEICTPCAERDRATALGQLIERFVTDSPEYRALPKIRGGYL